MKMKQQTLIKLKQETEETKLQKYQGFELKTKNGHRLDAVVSALQKAIRRGDQERALYFMLEMVESNFVGYFWRRISVIAAEDIGLADTQVVATINSLAQANERLNKKDMKDTYYPGMAVMLLCRADKSREVDYALDYMDVKRKLGMKIEPNDVDLDCHTDEGRERLRKASKENGTGYETLVDEKFYYEGILVNKPVSIGNDYWKKKVWEMRKLDKKRFNTKLSGKEGLA